MAEAVVDASAATYLLARLPTAPDVEAALRPFSEFLAPDCFHAEVLGALAGMANRGELSEERAAEAVEDLIAWPIELAPSHAYLARAWRWRGRLSVVDGLYVSLALAADAPLVTCDAGMAQHLPSAILVR